MLPKPTRAPVGSARHAGRRRGRWWDRRRRLRPRARRPGPVGDLLEAHELAFGASGRNLGYLDTSKDPALAPLARASLARYLELLEDDPPVPVFLDREPLRTLTVSLDEDGLPDLRAWVDAARAVGVTCESVDGS